MHGWIQRTEASIRRLPLSHPTMGGWVSHRISARQPATPAGQSAQGSTCLCPPSTDRGLHYLMDAGDMNSDPHTCLSSTLSNEPSSWPPLTSVLTFSVSRSEKLAVKKACTDRPTQLSPAGFGDAASTGLSILSKSFADMGKIDMASQGCSCLGWGALWRRSV